MKQLLLLAAVVSMAASGCVGTKRFVRNNCGPACHVARSQAAPRPDVVRTACYRGQGPSGYEMNLCSGLLYGLSPGGGCDCCGECCECGCGYPEDCCCDTGCCDCSCGCAEDCCCGDECCGDCCDCGSGCGCGGCGGLLGRLRGGCRGDCGCGPCQRVAGRIASGMCCPHSGGYPASYNFTPGPPSGQVAYPYYTTRGPRDFLMCNPPPLGPY